MAELVEKQYNLNFIEKQLKKRMKNIVGSDTDGKDYVGIVGLWKHIFPAFRKTPNNKKAKTNHDGTTNCAEWYSSAFEYWEKEENCPINDGMFLLCYLKKSLIWSSNL
jgi:hypothetical protein